MDILGPASLILMGGGFLFLTFGVARWTEGECRTIIAVWAEENSLTVLRCRRGFLIPSTSDSPSDVRVLYWLTVVDGGASCGRGGRRSTGGSGGGRNSTPGASGPVGSASAAIPRPVSPHPARPRRPSGTIGSTAGREGSSAEGLGISRFGPLARLPERDVRVVVRFVTGLRPIATRRQALGAEEFVGSIAFKSGGVRPGAPRLARGRSGGSTGGAGS